MVKVLLIVAVVGAGVAAAAVWFVWRAIASHDDFKESLWDRDPPSEQ